MPTDHALQTLAENPRILIVLGNLVPPYKSNKNPVILSEAPAESKDLRTTFSTIVNEMRKSLNSRWSFGMTSFFQILFNLRFFRLYSASEVLIL